MRSRYKINFPFLITPSHVPRSENKQNVTLILVVHLKKEKKKYKGYTHLELDRKTRKKKP